MTRESGWFATACRIVAEPEQLGNRAGGVFRQRVLAEDGGGGERDGQAGRFGDLLPGEVFVDFGIDRGRGEGLSGGGVELRVHHGIGFPFG